MTWTDLNLVNWDMGDPLTSADMKTYVRDNLLELKAPPSDSYTLNEASNYSTTSTTFVDVDDVNLAITIETNGGDVLVSFSGGWLNNILTYFDIDVDGTRVAGDDGIWRGQNDSPNFFVWISGLAAGSHTFKLQWKSGGTSTLYAGAGTVGYDLHAQFSVREVS